MRSRRAALAAQPPVAAPLPALLGSLVAGTALHITFHFADSAAAAVASALALGAAEGAAQRGSGVLWLDCDGHVTPEMLRTGGVPEILERILLFRPESLSRAGAVRLNGERERERERERKETHSKQMVERGGMLDVEVARAMAAGEASPALVVVTGAHALGASCAALGDALAGLGRRLRLALIVTTAVAEGQSILGSEWCVARLLWVVGRANGV